MVCNSKRYLQMAGNSKQQAKCHRQPATATRNLQMAEKSPNGRQQQEKSPNGREISKWPATARRKSPNGRQQQAASEVSSAAGNSKSSIVLGGQKQRKIKQERPRTEQTEKPCTSCNAFTRRCLLHVRGWRDERDGSAGAGSQRMATERPGG